MDQMMAADSGTVQDMEKDQIDIDYLACANFLFFILRGGSEEYSL